MVDQGLKTLLTPILFLETKMKVLRPSHVRYEPPQGREVGRVSLPLALRAMDIYPAQLAGSVEQDPCCGITETRRAEEVRIKLVAVHLPFRNEIIVMTHAAVGECFEIGNTRANRGIMAKVVLNSNAWQPLSSSKKQRLGADLAMDF